MQSQKRTTTTLTPTLITTKSTFDGTALDVLWYQKLRVPSGPIVHNGAPKSSWLSEGEVELKTNPQENAEKTFSAYVWLTDELLDRQLDRHIHPFFRQIFSWREKKWYPFITSTEKIIDAALLSYWALFQIKSQKKNKTKKTTITINRAVNLDNVRLLNRNNCKWSLNARTTKEPNQITNQSID